MIYFKCEFSCGNKNLEFGLNYLDDKWFVFNLWIYLIECEDLNCYELYKKKNLLMFLILLLLMIISGGGYKFCVCGDDIGYISVYVLFRLMMC